MRISRFGERVKSDQSTQASHEKSRTKVNVPHPTLDLFSTSPTYSEDLCFSGSSSDYQPCVNNAPLFAFQRDGKKYGISQGCCNSWTCPRCGQMRARQEYGRVVEGIRKLAEDNQIWFITITCRGKDMTKNEADEGYGKWTNKLLDAWRLQSKRTGQKWAYVQVTERQDRGHPHSHILTTFCPSDIVPYDWKYTRVTYEGHSAMGYVSAYSSDYIKQSCIRSGLGAQYDITPAGKVEAVSRYVAKYLFKDNVFNTVWPKNWRRIRYSQSFPKLPRSVSNCFILLKRDDWARLSKLAVIVSTKDAYCQGEAEFWLKESDVLLISK